MGTRLYPLPGGMRMG